MNFLSTHSGVGLGAWLRQKVVLEKLNNPIGYVAVIAGAFILAYVLALLPFNIALLAIGGMIAVPVVCACFYNLHFGINLMLVAGFLLGLAAKYTGAPIGMAMDGLLVLMLVGLLARLIVNKDFSFAKSPISIFIGAWIFYNLLQLINPWAESKMAWVYTVRTVALMLALYYIACYAFNSYKKILTTIKVILFLGFISALYSLKQEFIGFSGAEIVWLNADEERFMLIFQWNRLRVFSFFSDPTTFGIMMGYMSVFTFLLATGPFKLWKRIVLIVAGISMLMGMAYAGSRTPFVMIPLAVLFYLIMTFNKKTILVTLLLFVLGAGFVAKSTNSAVIWRIQSAFKGQSSDTIDVRMENQKLVQPFIQSHPIGAGLGSTGYWGSRFTPDSWLAGFAHDSLFVRLAVETGWIGLLIYMGLLLTALRTSVYYYFRVKDPTIKLLYLGLSLTVFMLMIASYPQEAITLPPTSFMFYIMLAMIVRLKDFDKEPLSGQEVTIHHSR